jgi:hypothetical protein
VRFDLVNFPAGFLEYHELITFNGHLRFKLDFATDGAKHNERNPMKSILFPTLPQYLLPLHREMGYFMSIPDVFSAFSCETWNTKSRISVILSS